VTTRRESLRVIFDFFIFFCLFVSFCVFVFSGGYEGVFFPLIVLSLYVIVAKYNCCKLKYECRGDDVINQESEILRELIHMLVKDLCILERSDASCCSVTIAQCRTVVEIGRKEKISLVDLANLVGVDKSTMSRTVSNLVEAGLVARDGGYENKRYIVIQLTEKGRSVFQIIEKSMERYYKSIFDSIPEDKKSQVLESLTLLIDAVRKNKCC